MYKELKKRAKELIIGSKPKALNVCLVYVLAGMVLNYLGSAALYRNATDSVLSGYMNAFSSGDLETAMYYVQQMAPETKGVIIYLLVRAAIKILNVGFTVYLINVLRNNSPCFGNLLDGFAVIFRLIGLFILKTALVSLGSILIVPGIIMSYSYRLSLYILLENPEMPVVQCMRQSRMLMRGHRMELFRLDISFILWYVAYMIPYVGSAASLVGMPYLGMTYLLFYDCLINGRAPCFPEGLNGSTY